MHDFNMCGCDNSAFIDGGDQYIRSGGKDIAMVKLYNEELSEDYLVEHLFTTVVSEIFNEFCTLYRLQQKEVKYDECHGYLFGERLISENKHVAAVKFILDSYAWFTVDRHNRKSVSVESGYDVFLNTMSKKYRVEIEQIDSCDIQMETQDRLVQNDFYRSCERISKARYVEDTRFCENLIRLRVDMFNLQVALACGKL